MLFNDIRNFFKKTYNPLNTIEINKKRLIDNYYHLFSLNKSLKIAPVLKSNAYGHGIIEVASILDKLNPPFFCVDSLYEAYRLLKNKINTQILITGYVNPENLSIKKLPFSYSVFDLLQFRKILKNQLQAKFHLFIDTGMNREGIRVDELEFFLKELTVYEKRNIVGVMSHLGQGSQNTKETKNQIVNFKKSIELLKKYSIDPKWIHLGNSEGFSNKDLHLKNFTNVARIGLTLYDRVLTLKTSIVQIKNIKKGEKIGYDFTYQAKKDGKIAILPIGYNDGVDIRLSNKGVVLINNFVCTIVGKINMNITVVDISDVKDLSINQEVIIFSNNAEDYNSIEKTAEICNTTSYEILIHLNSTIKRIIV